MTKKRKAVLAIVIAIAVAVTSVAGLLIWNEQDTHSYSRQIALGKNYFAIGDYEKALASYQLAVQLEPERVEGYEGLVKVYAIQGNSVMADSVIQLSVQKTGNSQIESVLRNLILETGTIRNDPSVKSENELKIDTALLRMFCSTTYNDYRLRDGISSCVTNDDGSCTVRVEGIAADLVFVAEDIDRLLKKPISTGIARKVVLDDATELFFGLSGIVTDSLRILGASHVEVITDKIYQYIVSFTIEGCEISIASDENGLVSKGAWCQILIPEAAPVPSEEPPESETDDEEAIACLVTGQVVSAVTGNGVSGVRLTFRSGSSRGGESVTTGSTGIGGSYNVTLENGTYTVEAACDGYALEYFELVVPAQAEARADAFVISPVLAEGQVRIVLEWGASPRDLDSHLEGRLDNGQNFHIYYGSPSSRIDGEVLAELDVDDRDGYGPETTTIYDLNGVFSFHVEDFTGSGTMSSSGATVKIYTPGQADPIVVNICNGLDNYWSVCTIDHGEVTVTNHS